ncbi:Leucine Rich repeat-containing protein [Mesobacillus persicus]|uniref:Leucine Rich repeat-containing protein n=1 Tax=Mesobacillus persicus TaxID=930146 RepID=A0A1H8FYW3_9BACI|nr:leucine-rich repeat domain-containing protein [Mesobacillus persicus]SEN36926.1 Leucine Rich repeat-containing protein [Mesobacillus persicus]
MRLVNVIFSLVLIFQLFIPVNVEVIAETTDESDRSNFTVVDSMIKERGREIEAKWLIEGEEPERQYFSIVVNGVESDMVYERTEVQPDDESKWWYIYTFPKEENVLEYDVVISNEKSDMEEIHLHYAPAILTFADENLEMEVRNELGIFDRGLTESDLHGLTNLIITENGEVIAAPDESDKSFTVLDYTIVEGYWDIEVKWLIEGDEEGAQHFSIVVNDVESGLVFERTEVQPYIDSKWVYTYSFPKEDGIQEYDVVIGNERTEMEEIHLHHTIGEETKDLLLPEDSKVKEDTRISIIKDEGLESNIRSAINKRDGELRPSDLEGLTELSLRNRGVTDLSGIEYATNLKKLDLGYTNIESLEPLTKLPNLFELDLMYSGLKDITELSNIKSLKSLNLRDNLIENADLLKDLQELEELNLKMNYVTDIQFLTSLPNLKKVNLNDLPLDRREDSSAMKTIQQLHENNVMVVEELPWLVTMAVDRISDTELEISWEGHEEYYFNNYWVYVDGEEVAAFDGNTTAFTIENLLPSTIYHIEVKGFADLNSMDFSDETIVSTLDNQQVEKPVENVEEIIKKSVVSQPKVENGEAIVADSDIEKVEIGDILVLDLGVEEAVVTFTKEQVAVLKEKDASLNIKNTKVELNIPLSNLPDGKTISTDVVKLDPIQEAVSDVYDFTIYADGESVHQFDEPITLVFHVDGSKVENTDNLKVFYYNVETKVWELVPGAVYSDGKVIAETDHFSIFTVFEVEDNEITAEEPHKVSNESPSENVDSADVIEETGTDSQVEVEEETGTETQIEVETETNPEMEPVLNNAQQELNKVTSKNEKVKSSEDHEGFNLPNTSTSLYNSLVFGAILLVLGMSVLIIQRRKMM